jgi:RHS repeat-associated protein
VNYYYDADGNRVEKDNGTLYWYGTSGDVMEETNLTGALTNDYVFFAGQRVARRDASGDIFAYFGDHLGSSRKVEEIASGANSASLSYDADFYPFGRANEFVNTSDPVHKFTGKERDSESNLDNFGARYFTSQVGRFMSPDRFGGLTSDPQSLNRYAYVVNNPVTFIDPSGLWHCVWDDGSADDTEANGGASYQDCADQGGAGWVSDNGDTLAGGSCSFGTCAVGLPTPTSSLTDLPSESSLTLSSSTGSSDDVAVGLDVWHNSPDCPNCGDIWQSTSGGMNEITLGYATLYGGAFLGAGGYPYLVSMAARGVGWGFGLTGGSGVVLGAYNEFPNYVDAAENMGANALNMKMWQWNLLNSLGETWSANQGFLDASVFRGQEFWLNTNIFSAQGSYYLELQYLSSRGVGPEQWLMVPKPF